MPRICQDNLLRCDTTSIAALSQDLVLLGVGGGEGVHGHIHV